MQLVEGHLAVDPPAGVPVWDVDPYDEAILADPVPFYAELRAQGPFAYLPKYAMLAVGRYPETQEVFSDHARFVSSRGVGLLDFSLAEPWRPPSIVLEVDPPYHSRTRRALMRALSPKAVAELRAGFAAEAEALVGRLLDAGGEIEAVADLAETFPCEVFPKAVGLRETNRRHLVDYGAFVFNSLGPDNRLRRAAGERLPEIAGWIMAQCARERLAPGGFGAALYAAADAGEIDEREAGLLVRSLLSAGVDTTVTGIGNALWCLAAFPEEYAKLRADPALARPAFEEALRLTSPVHAFCRTAAAETEVSGVRIAAGTKILCSLGAANLDPDRFPDPLRYDIGRKTTGHLALGVGVHVCVGQNVARAEGEAVLAALARRVARIEHTGEPVWRPNNAIRALDRLPLRLVPA